MPQWPWRAISWFVTVLTILAAIYEAYALVTGNVTISRFVHALAEQYHPVYFFAGLITSFLVAISLYGTHLPIFIRLQILAWLMVSAHIFWTL